MEPTPNGNTPAADNNVVTTTQPSSLDTLPKESVDSQALQNELERERARAKTAQQEAERLRKEIRSFQLRGSQPAGEMSNEESGSVNNAQPNNPAEARVQLERNVYKLFIDNPEFSQVLESDKTLKTFFEKDPLAVVSDPVSVEDATYQIKRFFEDRLYERKLNQVAQPPKADELPTTPAINPQGTSKISTEDYLKLDQKTQDDLFNESVRQYTGR